MSALLLAFFNICRFRLGPQDLPSSAFLLGFTLAVYASCGIGYSMVHLPVGTAIATGVLHGGTMIVFTAVLLRLKGLSNRLLQTLTALTGAGAIINLSAFPIMLWLTWAQQHEQDLRTPFFIWLGVFFWDVLVTAHIFRHALSTRFATGFLLSLVYTWLVFRIVGLVLPSEVPN